MSNTVDDQAARPESGRAGRGKTALVSVLILLAGVALMVLIFKTEPTATRGDVARETAMLVEVRSAERGRFTPVIEVMGRVVPARARWHPRWRASLAGGCSIAARSIGWWGWSRFVTAWSALCL